MGTRKTFNGKSYKQSTTWLTKTQAQKVAKDYRAEGMCARVVAGPKPKKKYAVFAR